MTMGADERFQNGGWDPEWENIFQTEAWGRYPSENVVRFIGRETSSVEDKGTLKALEIGSGSGPQIWFLAREGLEAHGVEGSPTAIEICNRRLAEEGLSANARVGDAIALDYADDTFDFVIDVQCLTCMPMEIARKAVVEAQRVLKPGGKLFSQTLKAPDSDDETLQRGKHHERKRYMRKLARNDVAALYGGFADLNVDLVTQTRNNGAITIEEWIIVGQK